ncbi:MAG: hypothetical protein K9L64_01120 [Candidatus Izimaplasma sp.]|nr:hypothetical protein [Candidatus Izimaplasma bacterium]
MKNILPIFLISDLTIVIITLVIALFIIIFTLYIYTRNIHIRKYNRHYKKLIKKKEKKYNANVIIDKIYNKYTIDETNTYKSLKRHGKRIVKNYLRFYSRELTKLAELKSNISPNKNQNKLVIILKNKTNQIIGKWYTKTRIKKFIKLIDRHQLLFDSLAYLYELPPYIHEKKSYHLENHDNKNFLSYKIVEDMKK